MTPARGAAIGLLLAIGATPAVAQRTTASLAAGFISVRYADANTVAGATLSPTLTRATARTISGVGGTLSNTGSGDWSAQGSLVGAFYSSLAAGWFGEFSGIAGGSTHADGAGTGQLVAAVRVHRVRNSLTAWLGGGGGAMWDGVEWNALRQGELGAAMRAERLMLSAVVLPTIAADTLRYADALGTLELTSGLVVYRATLGGRVGTAIPLQGRTDRVWGDVSITGWLAARTALVASAGTYPLDPTQGFPSGRFVSLALRVGAARAVGDQRSAADESAARERKSAGVRDFEARQMVDGRTRLRVRADGAVRVELTGDPTGWEPATFQRERSGWWVMYLTLRSGAYEMTLRTNGGAWVVPPGLALVVDEFGGRAGRLIVP